MQILLTGVPGRTSLEVSPSFSFDELAALAGLDHSRRYDVWFQHRGRRCREDATFREAGITDGDTIQAHLRLRGGGGDGGATGAESRASYLEMYMEKKPDKVNPAEEKLARWTTCKLSGEPLQPPCVVDELGSLYNKEALVSALVAKSLPKALGHISSLKHVKDVKMTPSTADHAQSNTTARAFQPGNDVRFQCPISGQPLNGQYRFSVIFPGGHVISEKAIKQVPVAVEEFIGSKGGEVRPLNGTQQEVEALWDKLIATRAASRKTKKDKQKANGHAMPENGANQGVSAAVTTGIDRKSSSENSPTNSTERKLQSHGLTEEVGFKRGLQDFSTAVPAKRVKAKDLAPANADKKVWASLFTSTNRKQSVETYSCRSTSGRGWM